jgi:dTMP kinase
VPERGRLIALEGIDGSGKSTQARALAAALGAHVTHEPGATPIGARLREMLVAPDVPAPTLRAEALLMAADRAEHVDLVLQPALAAGEWVVADRYTASELAYQGSGRGLDAEALSWLVSWACDGLAADLSVLVDVSPEVAATRLGEDDAQSADGPGRADRFERLGLDFATRVRAGYLAQVEADPAHWVVVDGTEAIEAVTASIVELVRARLGEPPDSSR